MNLRKASFLAAAGLAACLASPADARGPKPGHYAYTLLYHYGDTYELHEAGCVKWNYRNQSWYTRCGLPQNAVLWPHRHHHHRRVVSARY